ncbi:MAG: hypothetical protein IKS45_06680 [Thermoguttaceae bacterium]|nr:hypothetical protein [Thermoguttaceae bacterium]MBR6436174.1 hypothetical protein [Thermoguttaceae bacterium]
MGKSITVFAVIIAVFWAIILCVVDQTQFSRPFLLGSLTIIATSFAALIMGLRAVGLEPIKAYPWIMGGLAIELFIPLILVIYIKFSPNLLENSGDLVIILKYFLAFFPVCLIMEKTLVLREIKSNNTTDTKNER